MGRKGADYERKKLLKAVPAEGTITNRELRESVGFSERTYFLRRDELVTSGDLALGRGRGGTVYRIIHESFADSNRESDYYDDLYNAISTRWSGKYADFLVEKTAHGGSKQTGGRWTRPDITMVGMSVGKLIPPYVFLDVHTFEIKRVQDANITAVHEALQHRMAATHAWVAIVVPSLDYLKNENFQERLQRISQECATHGLGLVLWRVNGKPRWDVRVLPIRNQPSPKRMDSFLSGQLSDENVETIHSWFVTSGSDEDEDYDE